MSTAYSSNLALALPTTGELSGTWGVTVNTGITNMLDEALGYQAYSATGGADTITIPDGTTGVARSIYIQLNGTGGGSVAVPATKTKMYFVFNNTASAITFKVTGQTGVAIPAAAKMALVSNGTDVIVAQNYFAALTLGSALPVLSGGTGVTTSTGTGSVVLNTSPTLVTPALGTPTALVGTNITGTAAGLTAGNVTTNANLTGAITSTGNATLLGSFSSANLAGALTDETGSGSAVFATSPTLVTPILGTPQSGTVTNLTGTASININGTVGATTPTTGAFTTLTTSSTVTLSGGTANGVAYLNGSKVLTTGSALTFDGNNLTIGANGQVGSRLSVIANGAMATFNTGAAADGRIEYAYNGTNIFYTGVNSLSLMMLMARSGVDLGFGANNAEQMRLTSTGLGIGTSSPGAKLDVAGTFNGTQAVFGNTSGRGLLIGTALNGGVNEGSTVLNARGAGNGQILFQTDGTTRATITDSGNLRVGVPATNNGVLDINAGSGTYILDAINAAGNRYFAVAKAAPVDSFILDSSGNLGIGTSSPGYKLSVSGASSGVVANIGYNGDLGTGFYVGVTHASNLVQLYATGSANKSMVFYTGSTEVMRYDTSGNLGLGVTPSAWISSWKAIDFVGPAVISGSTNGAYVMANVYLNSSSQTIYKSTSEATYYQQTAGSHIWYNAPSGTAGNAITFTQAMTLDASGNLLVGTTSPAGYRLRVYDGVAGFSQPTSSADCADFHNRATTGDNRFLTVYTESTATARGSITYNRAGGLTAYNTTSDYRAKDIIGPVQNPGAMIDALKVYEGQMKGATQSRPMLIAHEAQAVTPYAVTGEKDAVNEDGTPKHQQMDVSALVPLLLAELQSLRARVAQLESKP